MTSDKNDAVSRHHDEDWDRKCDEEIRNLNQKIENGFINSSLFNTKITSMKECLRDDAERNIDDERDKLLDKIARCPGLDRFPVEKKFLASGLFGLKSQWYKSLLEIPLGCSDSQKKLIHLEEEVRWFRERLELESSFPDKDPLDCVKERLLRTPRDWDRFDFSHLTQKTAEDLINCLSDIEFWLLSLRETNNELML